jgi:hypothetical protein
MKNPLHWFLSKFIAHYCVCGSRDVRDNGYNREICQNCGTVYDYVFE